MLGKYNLHNLHEQSIQSQFLTLPLNWISELICLKLSDKTDHNCGGPFKSHFYKLMKNSEILRVISPFKHKVHNWMIQVILYFINLNHQSFHSDCKVS